METPHVRRCKHSARQKRGQSAWLRLRAYRLSALGLPADLHEGGRAYFAGRGDRASHRLSLPLLAGIVLIVLGRTQDIRIALRSPRMLAMAALTAALITVNWGTYVWAIGAGYSLDAALGYFINPLFSIFLGAVVLKGKAAPGADRRDRAGG